MAIGISSPVTITLPKPDRTASAIPAVVLNSFALASVQWWTCGYVDSGGIARTIDLPSFCVAEYTS